MGAGVRTSSTFHSNAVGVISESDFVEAIVRVCHSGLAMANE
jgi:hypothetical protein